MPIRREADTEGDKALRLGLPGEPSWLRLVVAVDAVRLALGFDDPEKTESKVTAV